MGFIPPFDDSPITIPSAEVRNIRLECLKLADKHDSLGSILPLEARIELATDYMNWVITGTITPTQP